ncbi:uncharacterized protein DUF1471 [Mangrovibacter plantisponsor]|uniref:Uncharacterized protein DUF1471 n=2 Tax=Enterobacteriaceae TaxID=543 RepID=A0A317Q5Q4_9ENTR|nr:uncharacterized protein DUF1471 [Mangrovibacter plantisponsor]
MMGITQKIVIAALAAFTFSAYSAEMMKKVDFEKVADQYTKVGTISSAGETSPMDAKEELSKKADDLGGSVYVLTSGQTENKIHVTADVYKKK